jgi:hypothetical protein
MMGTWDELSQISTASFYNQIARAGASWIAVILKYLLGRLPWVEAVVRRHLLTDRKMGFLMLDSFMLPIPSLELEYAISRS